MKYALFVSDNTPFSEPNYLSISQKEDGDIGICIIAKNSQERSISFRASGSRLKNYAKAISLLSELIDVLNDDEGYNSSYEQFKMEKEG